MKKILQTRKTITSVDGYTCLFIFCTQTTEQQCGKNVFLTFSIDFKFYGCKLPIWRKNKDFFQMKNAILLEGKLQLFNVSHYNLFE